MNSKMPPKWNKQGSERRIAPKLRFPEFANEAAWEIRPLGASFSERQEAGLIDLPLLSLTDKEGVIPQENSNRRNTSSVDKSKYLRVVPGDVAYNTMRMWEGRSAYVVMEGLVSPAYTVCKPNKGTDGLFFSYFFKTQPVIAEFGRFSQGLVKDTLNLKFEAFSKIEIASPGYREQKRIAACLSSLDELIAAQGLRLEGLRAHKKGLLQRLFPCDGETVPRLRFPEFRSSAKWVEKRLDDICEINPANEGLPPSFVYIDLEAVDGGALNARNLVSREDAPSRAQRLLKNGDVLFQMVRPYQRNNLFFDFGNEDEYVASTGYAQLRARDSNRFLYQLIHTDPFVGKVVAKCTGMSYPAINSSDLAAIDLAIPASVREQEIIASCLSSIDEVIGAQVRKVKALTGHKKALMQQLFPSPNPTEA